jgi:hypothetical protein
MTVSPILADRIVVDLIDRFEEVRGLLEAADAADADRARCMANDALRLAVEFLVQLREEQLNKSQT